MKFTNSTFSILAALALFPVSAVTGDKTLSVFISNATFKNYEEQ